jgi:hypothetical protein
MIDRQGHVGEVSFWFGTHFVAHQSAEPPSVEKPTVDPALLFGVSAN